MLKRQFSLTFVFLVVSLMALPFLITLNEFLANVLLKFGFYRFLESLVVPYEVKLVSGILALFPVSLFPTEKGLFLNGQFLELQWNCLGWQSLVFLGISLFSAFQEKFTLVSKLEAIAIGIIGTFLMNILRLATVGILAILMNKTAAMLFHDYFSTLVIILWLFFFWWFSYSFVLETKDANEMRM